MKANRREVERWERPWEQGIAIRQYWNGIPGSIPLIIMVDDGDVRSAVAHPYRSTGRSGSSTDRVCEQGGATKTLNTEGHKI